MSDQPQNDWVIVEPGLIQLATTSIFIRYTEDSTPSFLVERGRTKLLYGSLAAAKDGALNMVNELIQMGLEP